jgi:hypothetical protein
MDQRPGSGLQFTTDLVDLAAEFFKFRDECHGAL